jgi:ComF family protein
VRPVRAALGRVRPALEWSAQALVDFVVPDVCQLCSSRTGPRDEGAGRLPAPARYLYGETTVSLLGAFPIVNRPFCRDCLARLEPAGRVTRLGRCGVSLDVCSPFRMTNATLDVARLIKFAGRRSLAPLAAAAIAYALRTMVGTDGISALVPVPMHPSALRQRGFNQAALLAAAVSRETGLPVVSGALVKTARTPRQSQTVRSRRADNVRGAFQWTGPAPAGWHVCLIDDLVTTGATAAACTGALMAAGARKVTVACLAQAP